MKKSKRLNKRLLYVVLSIIVVSVMSLTIAYAVLSSNLTISGSTEVSGSSWNITISEFDIWNSDENFFDGFFDNSNKVAENGMAYGKSPQLIKAPTISGTTINDIRVSLTFPYDAIVFYYKVTNSGTIPAVFESITQNTPSFYSATNNIDDVALISNSFFSMISLYRDTNFLWENALTEGAVLCPGETIYFEFGAKLNNMDTISSSDITISNLGGTINFVQGNKSLCEDS